MRLYSLLALGLGVTVSLATQAQTVFTVGKQAVSKSEFLSWYQKNNNQQIKYDKASLENFANLYALYKMKVMEAEALQLDTVPEIKSDIDMYRAQLAKNYKSDKAMIEGFAKEAYAHYEKELKVSHIMLTGFGSETDARNKNTLDSIADQINAGKINFEAAAQKYSQDRGTAAIGGDMGFINAFQTPYEFEKAAYNTAVGKMSPVIKTQYGQHLIKVVAQRDAIGTYEVAQILLSADVKNSTELAEQLKLAQELKAQAVKSNNFAALVKQYSKDEYSNTNGGLIKPIVTGSTETKIEAAVMALKSPGAISEPVVSDFGVHIFQLIKHTPLKSYDEMKPDLIAKVERNRQDAIKQFNYNQVKKEIGVIEHQNAYTQLVEAIDQNQIGRDKQLEEYPSLKAVLFEVGKKKYTQQDFLSYVHYLTKGRLNGRKEDAFRELYRVYLEKQVNEAQLQHLEKNNSDFRKLADEYKNGVLIFDMMDKNIWSKANKDTVGIKNFYEANKKNYEWKPGFAGVVFQSKNHEALNQIYAALKAGASVSDALAKVSTPSNPEKIYQQTGRFDFEHVSKVDKSLIKAGVPVGVFSDGKDGEVVVLAEAVYPKAETKGFLDARDLIVEDYQKYLEKNWEQSLKSKYGMKLNTEVLNSLVK